ncbi:MAG: hypothetical protein NVSMB66_4040 [Candidatus Doudnabacteria bacterium]
MQEAIISQTVQTRKLQSYFLAAAFILLVLSLLLGIYSGVASGKDQATYKNVSAVYEALNYYNTDQGRYPSEVQFNEQKILIPSYLSAMPVPENAEGVCSSAKDFKYSQQSPDSFRLDFCLQKGAYGLGKGFHSFTEKVTN